MRRIREAQYERRTDKKLREMNRKRKELQPRILDVPAAYFEGRHSRYPERIRVSFSDGTTAVYELHVEQPAPVFRSEFEMYRREVGYQYGSGRKEK